MEELPLCATCANSVRCLTWAEWKCRVKEKRIYNFKTLTECESYKKRDKNFKERTCQCKDCLENDILFEEESEE